ncbi:hypothetical protein GWI33_003201 [Rhynchophorus ferrugineus]|uniref:Mos1 transposase HTH domain-containing protein n=1 Tax=Rhynchophorus ferrugineus TaxID=354439 RepID=A0A834MN30_RHYFE|nr:hypothetical protein GWI33_003201 [Rhynchophorus ferrugineus]
MDKKQFCLLIKYCFLKGKNTVEAETWLDAEFPDAAPGKPTKYCSVLALEENGRVRSAEPTCASENYPKLSLRRSTRYHVSPVPT